MEKVTIYTRPVDHETWEWARGKATDDRTSLARIVVDALRAYRDHCDTLTEKDRIER